MVWLSDTQFRFLDREGFFEVLKAYDETAKKHEDFVCPIKGGDIRDVDGVTCITNRTEYISGQGQYWVQNFDLNHYRKEREGTYECRFFIVAPTNLGLQKGKERLEEALSMADLRRTARLEEKAKLCSTAKGQVSL